MGTLVRWTRFSRIVGDTPLTIQSIVALINRRTIWDEVCKCNRKTHKNHWQYQNWHHHYTTEASVRCKTGIFRVDNTTGQNITDSLISAVTSWQKYICGTLIHTWHYVENVCQQYQWILPFVVATYSCRPYRGCRRVAWRFTTDQFYCRLLPTTCSSLLLSTGADNHWVVILGNLCPFCVVSARFVFPPFMF